MDKWDTQWRVPFCSASKMHATGGNSAEMEDYWELYPVYFQQIISSPGFGSGEDKDAKVAVISPTPAFPLPPPAGCLWTSWPFAILTWDWLLLWLFSNNPCDYYEGDDCFTWMLVTPCLPPFLLPPHCSWVACRRLWYPYIVSFSSPFQQPL